MVGSYKKKVIVGSTINWKLPTNYKENYMGTMHSITIHCGLEQCFFSFSFWSPNVFSSTKSFSWKIDGQLLPFCWPWEN